MSAAADVVIAVPVPLSGPVSDVPSVMAGVVVGLTTMPVKPLAPVTETELTVPAMLGALYHVVPLLVSTLPLADPPVTCRVVCTCTMPSPTLPVPQAVLPVATIGTPQGRMQVRAYVDEILVPRLPAPGQIAAVMTVHGSSRRIPLRFERIQPYVSPKIELSDQRQERVDVRVLPVVFSFAKPAGISIYPGQQVDIYIGAGK